jgi:pyruvate-formate lyase-activating enzyme
MDVSKQMEAIAQFGASLGIVDRAEIPSFHEMGSYKWNGTEPRTSLPRLKNQAVMQ